MEYYKIHPDLPAYLGLETKDFEAGFKTYLDSLGLIKAENQVVEKEMSDSGPLQRARLITLKKAGLKIALSLGVDHDLDHLNQESVENHTSYKLYRFQRTGILMFSYLSNGWEIAVCEREEFWKEKSFDIFLMRSIAYLLLNYRVISFFGEVNSEGLLLKTAAQDFSQLILVSTESMQLHCLPKTNSKMKNLTFVRLGQSIQKKKMIKEELYSFLMNHQLANNLIDLEKSIRTFIKSLVHNSSGLHLPHPYQSKSDLSQNS
jgi:hypothetical protein